MQYLRDTNNRLAEETTSYVERERQLTDLLLKLTTGHISVVSTEESKEQAQ